MIYSPESEIYSFFGRMIYRGKPRIIHGCAVI
jgi:hypothetical protein